MIFAQRNILFPLPSSKGFPHSQFTPLRFLEMAATRCSAPAPTRTRLLRTWLGIALLALCPCAHGADKPFSTELRIRVWTAQGKEIAHSRKPSGTHASVAVMLPYPYQPGDQIQIQAPPFFALQLDPDVPECLIVNHHRGPWSFLIPSGEAEKANRAHWPALWEHSSHLIRLRSVDAGELRAYRNVALNPCDQPEAAHEAAYPHAEASTSYYGMAVFAARNAIDGVIESAHHGAWPYQSWGPEMEASSWWRVDFGREVNVDKMVIYLRADFPHDGYWKSARIEFSDGSGENIELKKTAAAQEFHFQRRRTAYVRLARLVPAPEGGWCALTEVQVWGNDPL